MFHHDTDFLRALQADPWSEAQRLIYADWLEEQGCADQAEYLRLEHALGHLDVTVEDYFRQEVRLKALRGEVPQAWLQAVQIPYALVLGAPFPATSRQRLLLQEIANVDRRTLQILLETTPCLLLEGRTRAELERTLLRFRVPLFNRGSLPHLVLRPLACLRFSLRLEQPVGRRKAQWVDQVQALTGLGSKKAVALASAAPCVLKYDLNQPDAQKWQAKLTGLGGRVTMRLQARPARLSLCRVVLRSFDPRFRFELVERLLPFCPEFHRAQPFEEDWYRPDLLQNLPLVLKKCVWQDEAEEMKQRLERATGGEKMAEVEIEAF